MSDFREALAVVIDRADEQWQHGIGSSGYDPAGPPLWLADAVLALLSERLGGDEVREAVRDELSGVQVGSGYYSQTVGIDAAREAAEVALAAVAEFLEVQL